MSQSATTFSSVIFSRLSFALWLAAGLYWRWAARNVHRRVEAEKLSSQIARLGAVLAGFALIYWERWPSGGGLDLPLFTQNPWICILGLATTGAGLWIAGRARVELGRYWSGIIAIQEGHRIVRTGPYRYVRHPIYAGCFLALAGAAITAGRVRAVLGLALLVAIYLRKMRREERVLCEKLGDEYLRYRREVRALVPFLSQKPEARRQKTKD